MGEISVSPPVPFLKLEEAWIVQALVRDDGLTQIETAELLGRHKSWVCRRLALLERLDETVRDELRVGLLGPTAARSLVQLPAGNQIEVLNCARRDGLTTAEAGRLLGIPQGTVKTRMKRAREVLREELA